MAQPVDPPASGYIIPRSEFIIVGPLDAHKLDGPTGAERAEAEVRIRTLSTQELGGLLREAAAWRRLVAVSALGQRLGEPEALVALLFATRDKHHIVHIHAFDQLGRLPKKDATDVLMSIATDEGHPARTWAIRALRTHRDERVERFLKTLERSPDKTISDAAASALTSFREDPLTVERATVARDVIALTRLSKAPDSKTRARSVQALANMIVAEAEPAILRALSDPDPEVRRVGATAAEIRAMSTAFERLLPLLQDADADVTIAAVAALAAIGDQRAVPALIATLERKRASRNKAVSPAELWPFEATIAEALASFGDSRAFGALWENLRHGAPSLADIAPALVRSDGGRAIAEAKALAEDGSTALLGHAAEIFRATGDRALGSLMLRRFDQLGERHQSSVSTILARSLASGDVTAAIRALKATEMSETRGLYDSTPVAAMIGLLADKSRVSELVDQAVGQLPEGSSWVLAAIAHTRDPRAFDAIARHLTSEHAAVRTAAAEALGALRDPRAVPLLLRSIGSDEIAGLLALRDTNSRRFPALHFRNALARSLGLLGDASALPSLRAQLKIDDAKAAPAETSMHLWEMLPVVEAICRLSVDDCQPILLDLLTLGPRDESDTVLDLLRDHGDRAAVDPLTRVLSDPAWGSSRAHALRALDRILGDEARPLFRQFLNDDESAVHDMAMTGLLRGRPEMDIRLLSLLTKVPSHDFETSSLAANIWHHKQEPIRESWAIRAAGILRLDPMVVRARYEALAPEFGLVLAWQKLPSR